MLPRRAPPCCSIAVKYKAMQRAPSMRCFTALLSKLSPHLSLSRPTCLNIRLRYFAREGRSIKSHRCSGRRQESKMSGASVGCLLPFCDTQRCAVAASIMWYTMVHNRSGIQCDALLYGQKLHTLRGQTVEIYDRTVVTKNTVMSNMIEKSSPSSCSRSFAAKKTLMFRATPAIHMSGTSVGVMLTFGGIPCCAIAVELNAMQWEYIPNHVSLYYDRLHPATLCNVLPHWPY